MKSIDKIALNISEAAELLGVSRPTMYTLLHAADFPSFKVGSRTLICRTALEDWAAHQSQIHSEVK